MGAGRVEALSPISDAVVLVDVLSFTTCVDIATSNGAAVLPYPFTDDGSAAECAPAVAGRQPALEDWLGAGAVIRCLSGRKSPEAQAAQRLFEAYRGDLARTLTGCASGKELIGRGFAADVALAAQLDCSPGAPLLQHGAFVQ